MGNTYPNQKEITTTETILCTIIGTLDPLGLWKVFEFFGLSVGLGFWGL